MHHYKRPTLALSLLLASTSAVAAESVMQLIDNSKVGFDARYRFELVDQDNALRNAKAQTIRARLNLQTGKWYDISGLIEGIMLPR